MKTPMTRSALRAALRPLLPAIAEWEMKPDTIPLALKRAGYRHLPWSQLGIERDVLIGPRIVLKSQSWNDASSPRYRRSRVLCPTIRVAEHVIAQPRGICIATRWGLDDDSIPPRIWHPMVRAMQVAARAYDIHDDHPGNYAVFPDRTIRCIDY